MKKILLVEDDPYIVSSLTVFMKNEGVAAELICQKIDGLICHGQPN